MSFPNLYELKHVAESAAKSCSVCFRPCTAVLITPSGSGSTKVDWFYTCESHLSDAHFATLVYSTATGTDVSSQWKDLCGKVESSSEALRIETKKNDKLKGGSKSDSGWIKGLWKRGGKVSNDLDATDKEKTDATGDNPQVHKLKQDLETAKTELEQFERNNIKYKLDPIFYRARISGDVKKEKKRETTKKLQEGTLFPTLDGLPALPTLP